MSVHVFSFDFVRQSFPHAGLVRISLDLQPGVLLFVTNMNGVGFHSIVHWLVADL